MKVDFWQLSRDPAETVVALIAQRVRQSGEKLLVVSGDAEQLDRIEKALWEGAPEAFLANGRADAPHAARQPILLAVDCMAANEASHVVLADGRWRDEARGFERSFLLFGDDHVVEARECWKALKDAEGLDRSFYRQEGGKWAKVA